MWRSPQALSLPFFVLIKSHTCNLHWPPAHPFPPPQFPVKKISKKVTMWRAEASTSHFSSHPTSVRRGPPYPCPLSPAPMSNKILPPRILWCFPFSSRGLLLSLLKWVLSLSTFTELCQTFLSGSWIPPFSVTRTWTRLRPPLTSPGATQHKILENLIFICLYFLDVCSSSSSIWK